MVRAAKTKGEIPCLSCQVQAQGISNHKRDQDRSSETKLIYTLLKRHRASLPELYGTMDKIAIKRYLDLSNLVKNQELPALLAGLI